LRLSILENILRNHSLICIILATLLMIIFFKIKNQKLLNDVLLFSVIINLITFNIILIGTDQFDIKNHLPLHLCYLTEVAILATYFFNSKLLISWIVLNGLGGGITGFTNSNLDLNVPIIEFIHLYLSHFNLLLFSIITFKKKFIITKINFIKSIIINASIFFLIIILNNKIGSNYWFTLDKPEGNNLTNILPDWPIYLFVMIIIGIISYFITYNLFRTK